VDQLNIQVSNRLGVRLDEALTGIDRSIKRPLSRKAGLSRQDLGQLSPDINRYEGHLRSIQGTGE
jgi:hypothetical protein